MNVGDVATRVRRTFGDESGVQVTDDDVIRWINDAQEQIVLDNDGLMEATGTASSVANQKQYSLPADTATLRALAYKGYHLEALNFNEFNSKVDGYQSTDNNITGTPTIYMVWNNEVWLHPVPALSETNAITIYYQKHPASVGLLADPLSVPLQYHNAVIKYCMAQAYELDENFEAKQMKEAEFRDDTTKLNDRNKWTNQETYPTITTLPGDEMYSDYGGWLNG